MSIDKKTERQKIIFILPLRVSEVEKRYMLKNHKCLRCITHSSGNFQILTSPILVAALACLFACSSYDREEFRMEIGKKYDLKKWPDSVFIDTIDRYFANEPIKQSQKKKAEISMSMNNKTMSLPKNTTNSPSKKVQSTASKKSEEGLQSFPEEFFKVLDKLAENPSNKEFGKKHKAREGETLDAMLLRIYGSQVKMVPKYLSEDMLKRLNPSADFTSLSEGDIILLPVVK